MRERPSAFKNALRAQWLCAALDHCLGQRFLAGADALMAGYGSVLDHPSVGDFARAALSLRQLGVSVGSAILLRQAVQDALLWEEEHRP